MIMIPKDVQEEVDCTVSAYFDSLGHMPREIRLRETKHTTISGNHKPSSKFVVGNLVNTVNELLQGSGAITRDAHGIAHTAVIRGLETIGYNRASEYSLVYKGRC